MSTQKIRQTTGGQPKPPLTLLKELPTQQHAQIMEILNSHAYKEARPLVEALAGFPCSMDVLFNFRYWHEAVQELERGADRIEQIEEYMQQRPGNLTGERVIEAATDLLAMKSVSNGDVKNFATIMRLWLRKEQGNLNYQKLELAAAKFQDSTRNKFEQAFNKLAEEFKNNPAALSLYNQARAALGHPEKQVSQTSAATPAEGPQ